MMEKKYQLVAWTTNITDKESAKLQMIPSLESEIRASLISDLSDIHKEDYRCGYRISIGMARRAMLACEKLSRYYIFTGRYADGIRYLFFAAQYCVRGNLMQEFRMLCEEAISLAERHGREYILAEPKPRRLLDLLHTKKSTAVCCTFL